MTTTRFPQGAPVPRRPARRHRTTRPRPRHGRPAAAGSSRPASPVPPRPDHWFWEDLGATEREVERLADSLWRAGQGRPPEEDGA